MEFTKYQPGMAIEGTEPLENGRHECVIVSAVDGYDNNGNARQLVVFQPVQNPEAYKWPRLSLGDNDRGLQFAVAIADALGIDRSISLGLEEREIKGRKVTVTTRQSVDDQGRTNVWVDAIRPAALPQRFVAPPTTKGPAVEEEAERPARPARTPAAKVKQAAGQPAGGGDDDVPF